MAGMDVNNKLNKSCGCARFKMKDISGKMFGMLKAVEPTEKRYFGQVVWKCECQCENKNIVYVPLAMLQDGSIKSYGCVGKESWHKNGVRLGNKAKEYCIDGTSAASLVTKRSKANTSGYKGVCFCKNTNKWRAYISFKGKRYYLGDFKDIELAAEARKEAEKNLFGNFLEWYAEKYPERWKELQNRKKDVNN